MTFAARAIVHAVPALAIPALSGSPAANYRSSDMTAGGSSLPYVYFNEYGAVATTSLALGTFPTISFSPFVADTNYIGTGPPYASPAAYWWVRLGPLSGGSYDTSGGKMAANAWGRALDQPTWMCNHGGVARFATASFSKDGGITVEPTTALVYFMP